MAENTPAGEIDALQDVQKRLLRAADHLDSLASQKDVGSPERARLRVKREGVLLAESYVAESLRTSSGPTGGE